MGIWFIGTVSRAGSRMMTKACRREECFAEKMIARVYVYCYMQESCRRKYPGLGKESTLLQVIFLGIPLYR